MTCARALALAALAAACGKDGPSTSVPPLPSAPTVASAGPPDTGAQLGLGWAESVRRERWADAARQIDALPLAERSRPETLYARARVALAMGEGDRAVAALDGLERGLPLLAGDIQRWRAEAQSFAGPYLDAATYFAARSTPEAELKAALAFERAGDRARARVQCDRLLANDRRTRKDEAAGRGARARLSEAAGDRATAADDARWVAVHAPDAPAAKDADAALARVSPDRPLTAAELLTRARALADAGLTDDSLRALDKVASAPPPKVARLDELHARADILYRTRGRSLEAARVLDECASAGGPHALEDDFHAARALARADHDEDAIGRMALIARHHPGTTWGEEAQYFASYLNLLEGNWKVASASFDEYTRRYPAGVERREALRNGAIAHLMNQDFTAARRLFEQVAAEEPDPLTSARALAMAALGALRDGDRLHAIARWSEIVRSHPLTWPALVARTRLAEAGAPVPPVMDTRAASAGPEPLSVTLPPPVDLLHGVGLDADAEVALEEREAVVTSRAPAGRSVEALCAAYGLLGRAKRRYQVTRQIPGAALASAPSPATRWAWECAYPEPYADEVSAGAKAEAASLVYAVMRQESGFDPDAVSPAHAVGLMQLLPDTARAVAGEVGVPYDDARLAIPELNVALGARYLSDLRGKLGDQAAVAVAAYNAGDDAIVRWLGRAPGMELDVFVERIPFAETRAYVARVMGNYARYEYLRKGDAGVPTLALALRR